MAPETRKCPTTVLKLSESHQKQPNFLIPGTAPREAAKNGKLQPVLSYACFPLNVGLTEAPAPRLARRKSQLHVRWSRSQVKCLKAEGDTPGVSQCSVGEGVFAEGAQARWGPLKGLRGCVLRWSWQCVCPLSDPVRRPSNSHSAAGPATLRQLQMSSEPR